MWNNQLWKLCVVSIRSFIIIRRDEILGDGLL
jgi:hypothetical protein